ncbi:histamine H2 receptor isoform X1 [Zonotrichia albicollis]|uniref:histamine H2 receptor isoform X1 n=1 Tax=Zonotrichia albicollis TaxID=44394 RepID=UPI003D810751
MFYYYYCCFHASGHPRLPRGSGEGWFGSGRAESSVSRREGGRIPGWSPISRRKGRIPGWSPISRREGKDSRLEPHFQGGSRKDSRREGGRIPGRSPVSRRKGRIPGWSGRSGRCGAEERGGGSSACLGRPAVAVQERSRLPRVIPNAVPAVDEDFIPLRGRNHHPSPRSQFGSSSVGRDPGWPQGQHAPGWGHCWAASADTSRDFSSGKMLTDRNGSWLSNFSSAASSLARGGVGLQEVLVGLVLTLIDVVTLLGNTVVFLCPVVEKRLRTVTYMFIMSLAMADFLVACLVMPFSIIYEVTGMWLFGKLFCKVWISFDVMFCTASIVTLCFISLDRYCSVVTPYHYSRRMSRGRCIVMTCTVWVYSSLISFLPVMQGWNEIPGVDFDAGRECIFVTNWVFAIVASALAFFLPFMVMCSMYFFIYRASRLKATRIMSQTLEIHYHPNSKRQNHLQLENKATRTISIIISVFVLCWLPYFVLNVWLAARGSDSTSSVLLGTFKIITWLGYCNSTINPLLYAFLNRDFQHALKKLLLCRRRSQVDVGEDMVSIATFSKTAPELEYSAAVPNGAPKGKPKS